MAIDEGAMKVITDKLVDPWHKTFARDVVEMYEANRNKHSESEIGDSTTGEWRIDPKGLLHDELGNIISPAKTSRE